MYTRVCAHTDLKLLLTPYWGSQNWNLFYLFIFWVTGVWTQGPIPARQLLPLEPLCQWGLGFCFVFNAEICIKVFRVQEDYVEGCWWKLSPLAPGLWDTAERYAELAQLPILVKAVANQEQASRSQHLAGGLEWGHTLDLGIAHLSKISEPDLSFASTVSRPGHMCLCLTLQNFEPTSSWASGEIKVNKANIFCKWWTLVKKQNSFKPKPRGVLCFDWCLKQRKKVVSPVCYLGSFLFLKTVY
jgi:hypothetical protein